MAKQLSWWKRLLLNLAWKIDGLCHKVIGWIDPIPKSEMAEVVSAFKQFQEVYRGRQLQRKTKDKASQNNQDKSGAFDAPVDEGAVSQ